MEVYAIEELYKLNDWIKKISASNKIMADLHEEIQRVKDKSQEQFLEAKRYYNATSLEIFEDESKTNIFAMLSVLQ